MNKIKCSEERDPETGHSYFGARYYDPDLSALWLSVDPMADKYPGISPYAYCAWNPVNLVDPDGQMVTDFLDTEGNLVEHVEDGSVVIFQQKGTGENLHYEYQSGSDYGRADVFEAAIQAQEELNMSNDALKQKVIGGRTHCNQSVQNIMKMIESLPGVNNVLISGRANDMMETLLSGTIPYYFEVSEETAMEHASKGGFAIVGYQSPKNEKGEYIESGHVAAFTVGSLRSENQTVANIGSMNYTKYTTINNAISKKKNKHYITFIYVTSSTRKQ